MKGKWTTLYVAVTAFCLLLAGAPAKMMASAEDTTVLSSKTIVAGVTENIKANKIGEPKAEDGYSYNLQYGTFDEILNFSIVKPQNGLGSEEVYGNNSYTSAHINDGLIRVSEGYGLIYSLEVEQNYKVTITNPEKSTLNSYLYPVYLDTFVFNGEYRVNVNSVKLPLEEKNLIVNANAISHEVHIQAGDTLYFVISADTMGRSIDKFLPEFQLSQAEYDQTKRFDFASYQQFRNQAEALQSELETYFFTFNETLYSEDNYLKLVVLIEDAIKALDDVSFDTDLTAFESAVKEKAEKILTIQEEADELVALKTKRIAELEEYCNELLKNGYSILGKRDMKDCLAEGKTALQEAKSMAGVNVAFNSAKAKLLKVEKGSDLWLWLTIGGVVVVGAGLTAFLLLRKKKTQSVEE